MKKRFLLLLILFLAAPQIASALQTSDYSALRLAQSHPNIIELKIGETISFGMILRNNGSKTWYFQNNDPIYLKAINDEAKKLKSANWLDDSTPFTLSPPYPINPGEEATLKFDLSAPSGGGIHWGKFAIVFHGQIIAGSEIEIPVKVTNGAISSPFSQTQSNNSYYWQIIPATNDLVVNQNGAEPKIRVGLLYIEKTENKKYLPLEISTHGQKSYDVYGDKNQLLLKNTKGEKIKISFDFTRKRYIVDDAQNHRLLTTDSPLLMVPPANSEIIFKLDNWKNNTFWGEPVTDNEYYGQFKVEYNPVTERLWVINQLPIEKYLESVAEAGDDAPMEFLKAQAVAARTYAFYRLKIPKYTAAVNKVPFIDVRDTQADQVYRGVKKSERAPNFLQAVQETRGIIMTYMGDPALAYYFAQSDGKTRSANLVGMTKKLIPYLVAKDDPPGKGKKLLGHGVGMPQRSAITAAGQGATYSQILKYYYTNIDLTRMY